MEHTSRLESLCSVLGLDLKNVLQNQVDVSVDNIDRWTADGLSEETANRLASAVQNLSGIKYERFIQLKKMASTILSYWSILSTTLEEKHDFLSLLHYAELESEAEITEYQALSVDSIKTVENEFDRLEKQMAVLISKKKSKLDQIFQSTHIKSTSTGAGTSDSYTAFEQVKLQISEAKALSSHRKDMVTRVELLQSANEEIAWYLSNASVDNQRIARARILLQVFPKMLRDLKDKADIWKLKDDEAFRFDGIDVMEIVEKMEEHYDALVGVSSLGRDNPIDLEVEGVDINQLVVPRKARTLMVPVQAPLPPPPHHQVVSDGDDSMPSGESRSDPDDPEYDPGDSNESG